MNREYENELFDELKQKKVEHLRTKKIEVNGLVLLNLIEELKALRDAHEQRFDEQKLWKEKYRKCESALSESKCMHEKLLATVRKDSPSFAYFETLLETILETILEELRENNNANYLLSGVMDKNKDELAEFICKKKPKWWHFWR